MQFVTSCFILITPLYLLSHELNHITSIKQIHCKAFTTVSIYLKYQYTWNHPIDYIRLFFAKKHNNLLFPRPWLVCVLYYMNYTLYFDLHTRLSTVIVCPVSCRFVLSTHTGNLWTDWIEDSQHISVNLAELALLYFHQLLCSACVSF